MTFSRIFRREAVVVKALHPLSELSPQLALAPEIEIRPQHVAPQPGGGVPRIDDPAAAATRALVTPMNYPPLDLAVVPGDQLAIAIDETVPCAARVVEGVVAAGEHAGIERDCISIVADDEGLLQTLRAELGQGAAGGLRFVLHDPDDPQDLCLVGVMEKNDRLLVNRTLFEADVVLPVGCARLPDVAHSNGVYDSLFPRFCDAATIARLRTPSQQQSAARKATARRYTDEAGWLLGVPLVMQVVPGGGGRVAEVVAGEPLAVAEHCQQLCRQLWSLSVPRRASLVIASVTGGRQEQTWDNIARALAAAEAVVADGGAVAICSDLDVEPGHSLSRLSGSTDWAAIERDARNDHSADSWPAWQLARALQRGPVYFLSQLADETVEELGLAPVSDLAELARLASRHQSCLVLDDSQHAVATVAGEKP